MLFRANILLFFVVFITLTPYSAQGQIELGTDEIFKHLVDEPVFGGRAFLLEAGRGNSPTVLLVHGLGDQASDIWADLIPELASNYHVLAIDLPGFGRSDKNNVLYSPENYAAYLKWLTDSFSPNPIILIGHSMGGTIALRFAIDWPQKLQRLILLNVAGVLHHKAITRDLLSLQQLWPTLAFWPLNHADNWLQRTITSLPDIPLDMESLLKSRALRSVILSEDPTKIAALAVAQENFNHQLRNIRTPTFIIWGDDDHVTPLRTGVLLEAVLPGAQLKVIPGAGHVPMLEQPELFKTFLHAAITQSPTNKGNHAPTTPDEVPHPKRVRNGVCVEQSGLVFAGEYDRLTITGCKDIKLTDVTAKSVTISDSIVTMKKSKIQGQDTTLHVINSVLVATGSVVAGDTAMVVSNSRLDLAGVDLFGNNSAIKAEDGPSVLLFSVSRTSSSRGQNHLHGEIRMLPSESL